MSAALQSMLRKLYPNPKRIFLIDAAGAVVTSLLLLLLLIPFESFFGMPRKWLYPLSAIAAGFAVYSFCCYWLADHRWRTFLKVIAIANGLYCCLTTGLLVAYASRVTVWGWIYFIAEITLVMALVWVELKVTAAEKRYQGPG